MSYKIINWHSIRTEANNSLVDIAATYPAMQAATYIESMGHAHSHMSQTVCAVRISQTGKGQVTLSPGKLWRSLQKHGGHRYQMGYYIRWKG